MAKNLQRYFLNTKIMNVLCIIYLQIFANYISLFINIVMEYMIGNIDILVKELCKLPKEVGWVEFKHNNCEPNMIGQDRAITECNYFICNNIIAID